MENNIEIALPVGTELGDYRILRTLGQGGFGITYLAEVISSGEKVVIKENLPTFCAWRDRSTLQVSATNPNDELQEYPKLLTRFVEEARLLARLDHPNIVKVLDAFEALGTAYYVMPWLGGTELHKTAPENLTEAWLQSLLRTMLDALQYLHSNNIYHRDVKPGNILLTEDGTPVLIDFGTARAIISERSATLVGSPGYSPIEQMRAKGKRGPWTDIYSLGATCYRLITGECTPLAFDRVDEEEDPLRPLAQRSELFGRFRPEFLATIDKALAIRGKDRWQTTDEWLAALPAPPEQSEPPAVTSDPHSTTGPVTSIGTTPISVFPEPAPRKQLNMTHILGAVIILIFALGIPGVYLLYKHAEESTAQQLRDEFARLTVTESGSEEPSEDEAAEEEATEEEEAAEEEGATEEEEAAEQQTRTVSTPKQEESKRKAGETERTPQIGKTTRQDAQLKLQEAGISESEYNSKIIDAIYWNKPEQLALLIAAGADVSGTPLCMAAERGYTEYVKLMLAAPGINVNKKDSNGRTPLSMAAGRGHAECVQLLLAVPGINVNKENPLSSASSGGHTECVRLLLAAPGINVNKENPLSAAISGGHTECVQLLLAAPGIDVHKANNPGRTPLHEAARCSHEECVRLLLAAPGIDVNKTDNSGDTPLQLTSDESCAVLIRAAGGR